MDDSWDTRNTFHGDVVVGGKLNVLGNLGKSGTVLYDNIKYGGEQSAIDVSNTSIIYNDDSENLNIYGLTGGVKGQLLYIVKTGYLSTVSIFHSSSSATDQKILTSTAATRNIGTATGFARGGTTLICTGDSWVEIGIGS